MKMSRVLQAACVFAFAAASVGASCDPVHDNAIDALGPEAPGVSRGPSHRPGQPCITCHDGAIGDPPKFSVAGTIYVNENDLVAANGAVVTLTDDNGKQYSTAANQAGNFYVTPSEFDPVYPMKVLVTYDKIDVKMTSHVGRDGSCADCHKDPFGPTSAGHIFIPANGVTP